MPSGGSYTSWIMRESGTDDEWIGSIDAMRSIGRLYVTADTAMGRNKRRMVDRVFM